MARARQPAPARGPKVASRHPYRVIPVSQLTVDPARDAATLLRRLGVFALMVGLPLATFASRTGAVFAFAIGTALIVSATLFDGLGRSIRHSLALLVTSPAFAAVGVALLWAGLSILWAPAGRGTGPVTFGLIGVLLLGLACFVALPDRMRSANLYPIPIGAAAAGVATLVLALGVTGEAEPDLARRLDRGLAFLVLYAWPGVAWLRSRGRDVQAIGLALLAASAALFGSSVVPAMALAAGAVAYFMGQLFERGPLAVGIALAIVLIGAPALVVWAAPHLPAAPRLAEWSAGLAPWRETFAGDPVRLLTGHGIGSLGSSLAPVLPPVYGSAVLGLWYELGLVGAAAAAVAIVAALRDAENGFGPLLPGLAAAFATAFALALSGIDGGALWWPAALATVGLVFVATARGQFRTNRPRALAFGRPDHEAGS